MKGFFIAVFGILISIAIVRFCYGLAPNQTGYIVSQILSLAPDVRSEFSIVIDAVSHLENCLNGLSEITVTGGNIIDIVKAFFSSFGALLNIPFAFLEMIVSILVHLLKSLRTIFSLLFGPAVLPIN